MWLFMGLVLATLFHFSPVGLLIAFLVIGLFKALIALGREIG